MNASVPNDFEPVAPAPSSAAQPQIPNDFQPIAPPPQTAPSGPLPSLRGDVQSEIDTAAKTHGVPDWALRAIGQVESGGTKDPARAINPQSQASGALQLLPSTFAGLSHGNILNLHDNVDAGARYYRQMLDKYKDPVKAAGAYNFGPGNFDEYLAGKRDLPHETVAYMARVAASQGPADEAPIPAFLHSLAKSVTTPIAGTASAATTDDFKPVAATPMMVGKREATQKNVNLDPTKAHHGPLAEIGGHQDIPFILANAIAKDGMEGSGSKYRDEALRMWAKDPAAASDMYGPNSKHMLELYSQKGSGFEKAEAAYLLKHPWAAAGETFVEEMLNPVSLLEGAGIGKGLGLAGGVLGKTVMGQRLMHFASPYRELVAKHGENARNMIAQMGSNITRRGSTAMETVQHIFGGLTQDEQHEVVRLKQGLTPNMPGRADLAQRAAILHKTMVATTREQVAARALKPEQVADTRTFFPMRGAYDHPGYNDQTMSFMDQLRPNVRTGAQTPYAAPGTQHRVYATFDDSLKSPQFNKAKFVPATNLYQFLKARGGNVEFEDGIRKIAGAHPDLIRMNTLSGKPPVNKNGVQMIRAVDAIGSSSPALEHAWLAPEMVKFLTHGKGAAVATGVPDGAEDLKGLSKAFESYNSVMRASIMMNPLYHPFWNIATNSSVAAREQLPGVMRNYARALIGAAFSAPEFGKLIGLQKASDLLGVGGAGRAVGGAVTGARDAIEKKFWTGSQTYARDLLAAQRAGATAEFGAGATALGGDAAKIRTLHPSSLSNPEKLDKFLTGLQDWNTHATFGPRGEEGFASELFKRFTGPGYNMHEADAAWAVREALGNYGNVNPGSWQSKYMFFYPWLKTNTPFWLKTFLTAPRYATAPATAMHRESQIEGDPKAEDPKFPRKGNQAYLGRDDQGRDTGYSAPLPMKDAETVSNVIDPRPPAMGGENLDQRVDDVKALMSSRLKPAIGFGADVAQTAVGKAGEPGSYQGYTTAYNKDAPGGEQAKQVAVQAAERLIPMPMPFVAQDIERSGFQKDEIGDYAVELASAGMITRSEASSAKRATSKALNQYETRKKNLDKRQRSANPLSADEYNTKLQHFYDIYQKRANLVRDRIAKKTTATNADPNPTSAVPNDFVPNDFQPVTPGR